jgi:protein-tyrosine phosphatase
VASAGTSAAYGSPASEEAITAMREKGIDLCPHRSQPVSRQLVDAASVVVVMTGTHFDQVSRLFPHAREKLFLLKSFDARASGGDVADPLGASVEEYRNVRDEIDAALDGFVAFIQCLE